MKQTLEPRLGQNLAMTPQMHQAIRLLQLSSVELRDEVRELTESNYMLELADDHPGRGVETPAPNVEREGWASGFLFPDPKSRCATGCSGSSPMRAFPTRTT